MQEPVLSSTVLTFDVFEIDLRAGELRKDGRRVKLQEQPFHVLSLLLARSGEVVTREELRQKLWPADTFVDFDHGLNSAVARLRETLRDSADRPRFIETIAKRGYRFIAPLNSPASGTPPPVVSAPFPDKTSIISYASGNFWVAVLGLLTLLCAAALWALRRPRPEPPLALIEVVPLVGLRGF
jgi:DNA-binding winged helix-turn-helix (wHTH) protein